MLNANYISMFGMQRVDIMIRQKFLSDLRDLQEINDCFRNESSIKEPSPIKPSPLTTFFHRHNTNKIKKNNSLKLPKLGLDKTKTELSNKSSKNKEDAKHSLEKKTNANVYFWYYKDDPKTRQQQQPHKPLKLPGLVPREKERKRRRKLSFNSTEITDSSNSIKLEQDTQLSNINEDDKATEIGEHLPEVSKPEKPENRPPSVETVASVESDADFFSFRNKRRVILKTAQLKQLNVSPKFMSDAKRMVFLPACRSFHPLSVTKYVSETVR